MKKKVIITAMLALLTVAYRFSQKPKKENKEL